MKLKKTFSLLAVTAVFAYSSAEAAQCRIVSWKENMVLKVNSALYLGTRVQLPEGTQIVTSEPKNSNLLWDVDGAANQVLIRPHRQKMAVKRQWQPSFSRTGRHWT